MPGEQEEVLLGMAGAMPEAETGVTDRPRSTSKSK